MRQRWPQSLTGGGTTPWLVPVGKSLDDPECGARPILKPGLTRSAFDKEAVERHEVPNFAETHVVVLEHTYHGNDQSWRRLERVSVEQFMEMNNE